MPTDDDQTAAPVDVSEAEIGAAHTAYLVRNLGVASTPAPPEPPAGMAEVGRGKACLDRIEAATQAMLDGTGADFDAAVEEHIEAMAGARKAFADLEAALASLRAEREVPGEWQPIETAPKHLEDGIRPIEVLLRGYYPDGRTMSDVYHGWWDGDRWTRWPHFFPPSHFMRIRALPKLSRTEPRNG